MNNVVSPTPFRLLRGLLPLLALGTVVAAMKGAMALPAYGNPGTDAAFAAIFAILSTGAATIMSLYGWLSSHGIADASVRTPVRATILVSATSTWIACVVAIVFAHIRDAYPF